MQLKVKNRGSRKLTAAVIIAWLDDSETPMCASTTLFMTETDACPPGNVLVTVK